LKTNLKKELGLKNKDIAEFFDMSEMAFANSSAKDRYITALSKFYTYLKERWEKKIKEKDL
jgi:hypothetical protein